MKKLTLITYAILFTSFFAFAQTETGNENIQAHEETVTAPAALKTEAKTGCCPGCTMACCSGKNSVSKKACNKAQKKACKEAHKNGATAQHPCPNDGKSVNSSAGEVVPKACSPNCAKACCAKN